MTRIVFIGLALLVTAAFASAQDARAPLGPGSRVRVYYSAERLPPDGALFTGSLVSIGDTLVVATDGGQVLRITPRDIDAFEVSRGRRAFPYWLPALTGAAGGALVYTLLPERRTRECQTCREEPDPIRRNFITAAGALVGTGVGVFVARSIAGEQWEPAARIRPTARGVAVSLRF